jgi:acetyl-CoA acetyltransferase
LGFCPKESVCEFIRRTSFEIGGDLPLNTNGGQLSAGQAGAAGGFQNLTEGLRQIIAQPLGDQVPGAEISLVSGFGLVNFDRGVCTGAAALKALR